MRERFFSHFLVTFVALLNSYGVTCLVGRERRVQMLDVVFVVVTVVFFVVSLGYVVGCDRLR